MPRLVRRPLFPSTPGRWLACYRYRWQPAGKPLSPEHVGSILGVSGTTVRRWESDNLRPTRSDIHRFAALCELAPVETNFLLRAFLGQEDEEAPDREQFQAMAMHALTSDHPAFLMDSLFYIRGQNAYMSRLNDRASTSTSQPNALRGVFGPRRVASAVDQDVGIDRWVRSFWFASANQVGTPQYRELIQSMMEEAGFEERWWRIAISPHSNEPAVDLPFAYRHPERGTYRVFVTRITLPPVYYLREYVPTDYAARAYVASLAGQPNQVKVAEVAHWAEAEVDA